VSSRTGRRSTAEQCEHVATALAKASTRVDTWTPELSAIASLQSIGGHRGSVLVGFTQALSRLRAVPQPAGIGVDESDASAGDTFEHAVLGRVRAVAWARSLQTELATVISLVERFAASHASNVAWARSLKAKFLAECGHSSRLAKKLEQRQTQLQQQ
jgi:hypothetical protein